MLIGGIQIRLYNEASCFGQSEKLSAVPFGDKFAFGRYLMVLWRKNLCRLDFIKAVLVNWTIQLMSCVYIWRFV